MDCPDAKPIVECSFVTEFEDHIFVAMDAEVLLFLHDLITMYVKEKDKGNQQQKKHHYLLIVKLHMWLFFHLFNFFQLDKAFYVLLSSFKNRCKLITK